MTYAPGPWDYVVMHESETAIIRTLDLWGVAEVSTENGEANARLISAAPEMLEHGQFLLDRIDELDFADMPDEFMRDWMGHVEPALSRFRAILAKARGTT